MTQMYLRANALIVPKYNLFLVIAILFLGNLNLAVLKAGKIQYDYIPYEHQADGIHSGISQKIQSL